MNIDLDREISLMEEKYHGFTSLSESDVLELIKHFYSLGTMSDEKYIGTIDVGGVAVDRAEFNKKVKELIHGTKPKHKEDTHKHKVNIDM